MTDALVIPDRETLAKALAATYGGVQPVPADYYRADALIASGAVVPAATHVRALADDEALTRQVAIRAWGRSGAPSQVRAVLHALAAALTERTVQ
jgi:hypothetical protein